MIISAYINESIFTGLRDGDAERLTHVNFAFALVKDGKGSIDHWRNKEMIYNFIRNKGHLKVVLSVGGWGAGGFSPAVATVEGRELLAQSLVDIALNYGFDGIDMDWEYPGDDIAGIEASPSDRANYTMLIELIRQKLGKDKILSMAAGGTQKCIDNLEIDKLMKFMDFINLMTYDLCPWDKVSHHTALFPTEACKMTGHSVAKLYENAGVARSQIILGAAFYARVYKNVDGIGSKVNSAPDFIDGGYPNTLKRIEISGLKYDNKAEAAYAYDPTTREFISFDNPRSLTAKMKYVKDNGLGGIMFWEYSHDDDKSTLLKSITK
ncbi:MAG: glycosyl hydrolase family 18 protein [Defluviitaleaceae bacterium]|nr:glycosyl hydrolase family 18 protein [Defluviitaleaceae bacterium]